MVILTILLIILGICFLGQLLCCILINCNKDKHPDRFDKLCIWHDIFFTGCMVVLGIFSIILIVKDVIRILFT